MVSAGRNDVRKLVRHENATGVVDQSNAASVREELAVCAYVQRDAEDVLEDEIRLGGILRADAFEGLMLDAQRFWARSDVFRAWNPGMTDVQTLQVLEVGQDPPAQHELPDMNSGRDLPIGWLPMGPGCPSG